MKRTIALMMSAAALLALMVALTTSSASSAAYNYSKPTISGTARIGVTMTASRGGWRFTLPYRPVQYQFMWLKDGVDTGNATQTLTPQPGNPPFAFPESDLGSRFSVRVTATWKNANGTTGSASAESAPTYPVLPGIMTAGNPSIVGTMKVGQTVELKTGVWTPDHTWEVQWQSLDPNTAEVVVLKNCGWDPQTAMTFYDSCTHYGIGESAIGKKLQAVVKGSAPDYLAKTKTANGLGYVKGP